MNEFMLSRELIESLQAEVERLNKYTQELSTELAAHMTATLNLREENQRLREALNIIAGYTQCADNLMSNADIARAVLEGK